MLQAQRCRAQNIPKTFHLGPEEDIRLAVLENTVVVFSDAEQGI